jgi:transmembrane sensor
MKENDQILIVKYITGQATDLEITAAKGLINSDKKYEEYYIQQYEAWQRSIYYNTNTINTEKAYSAFLAKSAANDRVNPFFTLYRLSIAASLFAAIAFGLYFYNLPASTVGQYVVENEINVPKGSTKKTVLLDGTIVWVNAGSFLKFEEGYGKTSRTVYLDGEAYFDIAPNKLPFIVKTKHHTIRDIGTVFNVKAYSDDLELETAVIEGEVSVENKVADASKTRSISVKKQQVLKLSYVPLPDLNVSKNMAETEVPKIVEISSSQLELYTGWTEDLLVFEGKTFQEISKIMERKYDVEIVMKDPTLRNYEYTGSFKNIDDVEKALQILKETTAINYNKNGRIITIWGITH